ncbi:MAG: hypothetical protein GY730_05460 [bacterium]|nr:hypothetical protein [bacterium]
MHQNKPLTYSSHKKHTFAPKIDPPSTPKARNSEFVWPGKSFLIEVLYPKPDKKEAVAWRISPYLNAYGMGIITARL